MDVILNFVQYFVNLGPAVMLPIVIFIVGLVLGQSAGKALRSGISIGIGFIGIGLVISLMLDNLAPAAQAMSANFGISMNLIDVGWPGMSPITWASQIALVAIPVAIAVNILMLALKLTRVVNIDIWNIWHFAFTGAIVNIATGSYALGIVAVAIHAAYAFKMGDWFIPVTEDYFGLEGIAMPHGSTSWFGPVAVPINCLLDRIPVIKDIDINLTHIEKVMGHFGDPSVMGGIMGVIRGILTLGIQMAAVIVLMPQVVKHIMNGLLPISEAAKKTLQKRFSNSNFYIGLDCALLLGDPAVVTASLLFIPLTILIAAIVPGNQILPFGDLPTIGFFIAMAVGVHKGNLFRTVISGSIIMFMTIWIANQTIGLQTALAAHGGMLKNGVSQIAGLDQGGAPITYLLSQAMHLTDLTGFLVIGIFYVFCLVFTYFWHKKEMAKLAE
ncbi:MAG: PTS galactitol transporter subunit IIC [Megasphaera sp.]|uniref:PTS galactitol transporter subunit IIC n=1 Tax=uncultured Megasphaera sp. TaxID=165188 RepID=UPI00258918B0|nr:PTS transporter subunit IIC [uncultured Megasphaera sp.]MBS6255913.1 PTS galactitol transporter subunit IIC [Megasphaera sp.]